jgi:hypothetical protein
MTYDTLEGAYTPAPSAVNVKAVVPLPVPCEDAAAVRRMVLRAQDQARMKALEQAQIDKYVSWNTY